MTSDQFTSETMLLNTPVVQEIPYLNTVFSYSSAVNRMIDTLSALCHIILYYKVSLNVSCCRCHGI